ncbi:hypothetical protein CRM22_003772 [Opisthorchis felineus]|uniref:Uncharacterized protein n=1 Tax=Opisthorchis felineus TaxID=147828 RepID=A0A4S2LZN2_OPIFE|nr:hypothetical protein CRM22_003772 [Opisthorchis felineus]
MKCEAPSIPNYPADICVTISAAYYSPLSKESRKLWNPYVLETDSIRGSIQMAQILCDNGFPHSTNTAVRNRQRCIFGTAILCSVGRIQYDLSVHSCEPTTISGYFLYQLRLLMSSMTYACLL